ncbi:MAG: hypothetical protein ACFFD4_12855 [Candidatus Odinarchaeota archaeon]
MIIEKVSTVGVRNQITLPKLVREKLNITVKTAVFIQSDDKADSLVMTLEPPQNGVFNRITISGKGQLVIPGNLRLSKGIKEGTNLIFSLTGDRIKVQKLARSKQKKMPTRWTFFLTTFKVLLGLSPRIERENDAIVLTVNGQQEAPGKAFMTSVKELEDLVGSRLMIEKLDVRTVKLSPLD